MDKIKDLRLRINEIDREILELIIERFSLVSEIGEIKNKKGIAIVDKKREQEILENLTNDADKKGLDPEIVKKVWKVLMEISYEVEGGKNGNS